GVILEAQGKLSEAIIQYRKAASLPPEESGPYLNLGRALEATGDPDGALVNYRLAISISPGYVAAYYGCGNVLTKLGRPDDAAEAYRKALDLEPNHRDARLAYDALLTRKVSFWHFPMMNDTARNDAFEGALKAAIRPGSHVLDIGSGSGLLALMAARAGAARVDTVEVVTPIADVAQKIVDTNGYGKTVTIHNKLSTAMEVGPDLTKKADILVTETFDVGVLGEHVVSTIRHARANLLTEDAVIIPQRAEVIGALFESEEIYKRAKVHTVSGFDLSEFNTFKKPYHQLTVSSFPHRMISRPFPIFNFDFTGDPILPESKPLTVSATEDAVCHGVIFWFRLMLDDSHEYDTGPTSNPGNHWEQAVHILDRPIEILAGGTIPVTARHNNRMISFSFE
ncbi:MAG: 16S rRNA G966 N2-methylase RsmD, partial [Alphaproteobacteria bacterium]